MTPAENLCQELDGTSRGKCPGCNEYGVPPQMEQAAALIRRLAGTLEDVMSYMQASDRRAYEIFAERHAEALRDVKEQA